MLAKHYNWDPLYETVDNNPYLEDFYNDMKRWSFNLQVYFLNSRFQQIIEIQKVNKNIIQDRTIYEDAYIFAENLHEMGLMPSRDYENYKSIFENITAFIRPPDLVIYLKASVPTLVENIQRRGREYEAGIRLDYLQKLNNKYEKWITHYNKGKVLILDKDKLDFANQDEHFSTIIAQVDHQIKGFI